MNPILYVHGGSGNHGCEAIVRTFVNILHDCNIRKEIVLSANFEEDIKYDLIKDANVIPLKTQLNRYSWDFLYAYLMNCLFGKYIYLDMLDRKSQLKKLRGYDVAIAIGGDTYSYGYTESNTYMHNLFRKQGLKTVLWACSIEPQLLNDDRVLRDICNFDMITVRESITYKALKEHNVQNVYFLPDLAFTLESHECDESKLIRPGKTIGLNLSPLVQKYQQVNDCVFKNYCNMINYILNETDYDIALIPHVVWPQSDDREVMQKLFNEFKYSSRLIQIADHNCMELKDIIARCRMFVCARTHASIAAYSTCVPTIVLGYSVKARGIARDIWGEEKNYVIPVQSLKTENDMVRALQWMMEHEDEMRRHLLQVMPNYVANVNKAKDIILSL